MMFAKNAITIAAAAGILCLCGCFKNLRTDPNEPLDKVTFGESCQHYLLGAHDCRRSPKECTPICIMDIERFQKSVEEQEAEWAAFRDMMPYRPKRTGIRLLDRANQILAKISVQIKYEVVVPYRELDKQGHIAAYKTFISDVEYTQREFKLAPSAAAVKVYSYWSSRYGEERCRQLMDALPCIENMKAHRQLLNAIERNDKKILDLIISIPRDVSQLKAAAKTTEGIVRITLAGEQTLLIANQLRHTLAYLGDICRKETQDEIDIKAALKSIQKYNEQKP